MRNYLYGKYPHHLYFECHHLTEIVICDPPPPPSNGYIMPYSSTVEEASVTYVFQTYNKIGRHSVCADVNFTAVCNKDGQWEPDPDDTCFDSPGKVSIDNSQMCDSAIIC